MWYDDRLWLQKLPSFPLTHGVYAGPSALRFQPDCRAHDLIPNRYQRVMLRGARVSRLWLLVFLLIIWGLSKIAQFQLEGNYDTTQ